MRRIVLALQPGISARCRAARTIGERNALPKVLRFRELVSGVIDTGERFFGRLKIGH